MSESLIIERELLHAYDKEGNKIVKEIPIYKTGVYKGELWLDKNDIPFFTIENLGLTGDEIALSFINIWDENTGASAKKVRVILNNNLEDVITNPSKWGEEQVVKIEWARARSGRRYQSIYLLPVP